MAKKPRSEKQLANDARLAAAAKARAEEAKKAKETQETVAQSAPTAEANQDYGELIKQLNELKDNPLIQAIFNAGGGQQQAQPQQGGVTVGNKMTGVFEKYIMDPAHYPDPRERLFEFFESSPKYRRFGLRDRFVLRWEVQGITPYERKDGVLESQPRFLLGIDGIVFDEETYEPTDTRYVLKELMFFEDPQTAVIIARDNGIDVDETNEKVFMDEMRFIRARDWLIECFMPNKVEKSHRERRDEVLEGKQFQVYTASSAGEVEIPFNKLKKFKA